MKRICSKRQSRSPRSLNEQIQLNRIEDSPNRAAHAEHELHRIAGFSQASIRGVGTDLTNLANETAIAMYEDGVYRGATFSQTVPQFDMERIEVLRGPQGTLYGRNATGGAINIVTRMPSQTPEFNASFTGGNYDARSRRNRSVGAIDRYVLGRASFITDSHSGFNDNKTLGHSEGDESLKGGHAALQFDLSETANWCCAATTRATTAASACSWCARSRRRRWRYLTGQSRWHS